MESYRTVRAGEEAVGEVVDRKSRFIAQLVHVECEEDAAEHIAAVRSRHFDARHNVPAWILADGREAERFPTPRIPTRLLFRSCLRRVMSSRFSPRSVSAWPDGSAWRFRVRGSMSFRRRFPECFGAR